MDDLDLFYTLIEEEWEETCKANPLFATRTGNHKYNDKLPEKTYAFHIFIPHADKYYNRLLDIDPSSFSKHDSLNYEIYKLRLEDNIERLKFKMYRMPISKVGGLQIYLPQMHLRTPFNSLSDFQNFLSRLNEIPDFIDRTITMMRDALREKQVPPKVTMAGVIESIRQQIASDPTKSPYFKAFEQIPENLSSVSNELVDRATSVISDKIYPALEKFVTFLEQEYLPKTRDDIAISNLPNGRAYYDQCIRHYTTLDLSAEEIHQIGLDEVQRIRSEMEATISETGFEGTIKEFIEFLRSDPQFYANSATELLEKTSLVLKRIDGELPSLFKTLPRLPYGIKEIPEYIAPGTTTAYYSVGTGDGTKAGTYYVNTYKLESRPLYQIEALSLHEAVPGHHLQLALQMELDLPNFRRFGGFGVFVEGWALYSERLGLECGFYQDPYSNFGRLSYEMWRATRLVVDTGMHALRWTRQEAIDFMVENTSLSILNIENEIDRYIAWPGQALSYKIGELKIRELRTLAEKELGEKFDLREFHDIVLLSGSVPLSILSDNVKKWIDSFM